MRDIIRFANANPGWHSHAWDITTLKAIKSAERKGRIERNAFGQFRAIPPEKRLLITIGAINA